MSDSEELPRWAKKSREHIERIKPKIDEIKKEGQAEIKRGLEKADNANRLQNDIDYLDRVLAQPHSPEVWNDEIIQHSGSWLTNRIETFEVDVDKLLYFAREGGKSDQEYHEKFNFALPSTDTSAGTAIYLGASLERRFEVIEPAYHSILLDDEPERLNSREYLFEELKATLKPFGAEYVSMLEGSETALNVDTPDSQSQAAHSMRDCFQQLLEYLAPSKVVETQPWFVSTAGAPGGISRRSRLRYMIYGAGENIDDATIKRLDELSDIAKNSLDLSIARAHDHDPSLTKNEVILSIDHARHSLLQVLKYFNLSRGK